MRLDGRFGQKGTGRQSAGDQERGPSFTATTPSMVAAYKLSSASTIVTWAQHTWLVGAPGNIGSRYRIPGGCSRASLSCSHRPMLTDALDTSRLLQLSHMGTCERQWSPARRRSCMRSSMAARSCCGELAALACRRSALLPCGMATHILGGLRLPRRSCSRVTSLHHGKGVPACQT